MKKTTLFSILFLLFIIVVNAQPWLEQEYLKKDHSQADFYDIQKAFYKYWGNRTYERGKGYVQFKRWEYFMEPLCFPDGKLPEPLKYWNEYQKFLSAEKDTKQETRFTNNWIPLGITSWINGSSGYNPGQGRINVVAIDPNNANVIYVGAPAGGIWKSVDGGASWNTTTDYMPRIGVSTIAIDKNNTNIVYIGTGDRDGSDCAGIGVMKSVDAGATWNTTGLSSNIVARMLINPQNSNSIIAACSNGIYKTVNAGTNWTKWSGSSSKFYDLEYNPGDTSILYATTSNSFYQSTDGGKTFIKITSGLPSSASRFEISIAPSNASYVYLVAGKSDNSFQGLYRSTDNGTTFVTRSTSPNIFGYNTDGSDDAGQAWWDLAIVTSPTNAEEIYVGSINQWKSTDGGINWKNLTQWTYTSNGKYTHCDEHELIYPVGSSKIYTGTDGGVYYSTNNGSTWTNITTGIGNSQFYKIGITESDVNYIIGGLQDNGCMKYTGTSKWTHIYGADCFESVIDFTDKNIIYSEVYNGSMLKSTNAGNSWKNGVQPSGQSGAWSTPYLIHPTNNNLLYMAFKDVYKTTNATTTWTAISSGLSSGNITTLESAPSDANYIYAGYSSNLYVTTNGGTNWTTRSPGSYSITGITVDHTTPSRLWICCTSSSASKVFMSTNSGTNWIDITGNLTNLGFRCIIHQKDVSGGLYLGTEVGIFYKDSSMTNWISYNNNLPTVRVTELEITYNAGLIRAGTFGRGIWESQLYNLVDIKQNELNDVLTLYPNPAKNNISITFSLPAEKDVVLSLFDVNGKQVKSIDLGKQKNVNHSFDLSSLVEGTYFIHVMAGDTYIVKKIMKL